MRISNFRIEVDSFIPNTDLMLACWFSRSLDNSVAKIRIELPLIKSSDSVDKSETRSEETEKRNKVFMVIGINTAFSSRKRRDSVRETWMPQGDN